MLSRIPYACYQQPILEPVSYTHLDVYKRQSEVCPVGCCRDCDRVLVWMFDYSYALMFGLLQEKARLPEQGREAGTGRK